MKQIKCIAAALAMLLLAGCAENPDSDIVIHKDMEKRSRLTKAGQRSQIFSNTITILPSSKMRGCM